MAIFAGTLKGNGYVAQCLVTAAMNGANYVAAVTPDLPDGDYDLAVNGSVLKVRQMNGYWRQIWTKPKTRH